ncbi:class I SAM-dependent methyltransferase [Dehalococcoidia bacterium]|nr:class I SAM-dependent methyltransferase [Dehalococcoidia bacterium]
MKRWGIAQKAEKEGWQNWKSLKSDSTSKQLNKYWGWYIDLIAKYISFSPEWKILDIGCGPDGIISHIPVGQRFGLDPLMDFYLSNFELPPDIEWGTGNLEDIPFDSDYFDAVITTNTLDHSLEPAKGLKEIHRVLKPGGFLILTVNCYAPLRRLVRAAREKVGLRDKPHPYNFPQRQVKAMIKETGFTLLVHHKGIGTMGEWFYDRPPLAVKLVRKVVNIAFWLENKFFGYSCRDFIFIAQKR